MAKFSTRKIILTLCISIIIFTAAIYSYSFFFAHFVPKVQGAIYKVTNFETPFNQAKLFAGICAAVPFLCLLLFRLVPIPGIKKQVLATAIIVVSMLVAVFIRRHMLQQDFEVLAHPSKDFQLNTGISTAFDQINFEYWLAVGMLSGAFICFAFFKRSKNRWTKSYNN